MQGQPLSCTSPETGRHLVLSCVISFTFRCQGGAKASIHATSNTLLMPRLTASAPQGAGIPQPVLHMKGALCMKCTRQAVQHEHLFLWKTQPSSPGLPVLACRGKACPTGPPLCTGAAAPPRCLVRSGPSCLNTKKRPLLSTCVSWVRLPNPSSEGPTPSLFALCSVLLARLFALCFVLLASLFAFCSVLLASLFALCSVLLARLFALCSVLLARLLALCSKGGQGGRHSLIKGRQGSKHV